MYLRTILRREDEELVKRIFREQEKNTTPGDYVEMVKADLARYNICYDENMISTVKEEEFKKLVRKHVKETAFKELRTKQESHSKVKLIVYEALEKQPYLVSPLFTDEDVGILSNLRSHTTRGIRGNFGQLYKNNSSCPLKCWPQDSPPLEDTQQHLMVCRKITLDADIVANNHIKYDDIYGSVTKQKAITTLFQDILHKRQRILESSPTSG